jgi:hypothetical protein
MPVRGLSLFLPAIAAALVAVQPLTSLAQSDYYERKEAEEAARKAQDAKNSMRSARLTYAIREAIQQVSTEADKGVLDVTAALKVVTDDAQTLKISAPLMLDEIEAAFMKGCLDPEEKCYAYKELAKTEMKEAHELPPQLARIYALLALARATVKNKEDQAIIAPEFKAAIDRKPHLAAILIKLTDFPALPIRMEAANLLANVVRTADLMPMVKAIQTSYAQPGGVYNFLAIIKVHGPVDSFETAAAIWRETDIVQKKIESEGFMGPQTKEKSLKLLNDIIELQIGWVLDAGNIRTEGNAIACTQTFRDEAVGTITCEKPHLMMKQRDYLREKQYRIAMPMDELTRRIWWEWKGHEPYVHNFAHISDTKTREQVVTSLIEVCRSLGAKSVVKTETGSPEQRAFRRQSVGLVAYESSKRVLPQSAWYLREEMDRGHKNRILRVDILDKITCSQSDPLAAPSREEKSLSKPGWKFW